MYERENVLNKTSFDEKDSKVEIKRWRKNCGAHKHIHGVCKSTCYNQVPLDDARQAILLLCTLSNSRGNLVVTLNTSCQEENLFQQVVKTSILNEEMRRKD